jgi:hypothetical protein
MTEYRLPRWWLWMIRTGLAVATIGGVAMLAVAAAAHDSASIPIAVIGGGWLLCGIGGLYQRRTMVQAVQVQSGRVTFRFLTGETLTVPATAIVEVRRGRFDPNRFGPLRIRTKGGPSLRLPGEIQGLLDLLVQLRLLNPDLDTTRT